MEENENVNFNKLEAKDGKLTIHRITQELETPIVHNETGLTLSGTIQAPGNFIDKRNSQNPLDRCNIQYSFQGLYIKLTTMENHPLKYNVDGVLKPNPDIVRLKVNTKEKFSGVKDLTQHLRFNRYFFADKEENNKIITNLQNFRVAAQKIIESKDDLRGNQLDHFEIKNESNIDLSFNLSMPIYIGQPNKKFKVEIAYDVREKSIDVWLESPELVELLKENAVEIIQKELERFPKEFVLIEQ